MEEAGERDRGRSDSASISTAPPADPGVSQQPAARRTRTQAERRRESTRQLMRAAAELVAEKGWTATSLSEVARRAGYSATLVGQRFGSKAGLVDALVERHARQGARVTQEVISRAQDPREAISEVIRTYASTLREHPTWSEAILVLMAEALGPLRDRQEIFRDLNRRYIVAFDELLEAAEPRLMDSYRNLLALRIVARLRGLTLISLLDQSVELDPCFRALEEDIVFALAEPDATWPSPAFLEQPIEPLAPSQPEPEPEPPGGRRTQAERRHESTKRLLRASAELLAERGVTATTVERIARRAGYSPGLVTQRFGSKEKLIDIGIRRLLEGRTRLFEAARGARSPAEGVDTLIRVHASTQISSQAQRLILILMGEALGPLRQRAQTFSDLNRTFVDALVDLIEQEEESRFDSGTGDAEVIALGVVATLRGLAMMSLLDSDIDLLAALEDVRAATARELHARGVGHDSSCRVADRGTSAT